MTRLDRMTTEDLPALASGELTDAELAAASAGAAQPTNTSETRRSEMRARLMARRFNFAVPPAQPIPRFLINARAVCTPGNLTNLIGQAKTAKSATIGAMLAAAICAESSNNDRDTLGISATAPGTLRLLHIDTEQSPFDADQLIRRSLRRAGVDAPPPWLESYGLAGFSAGELRLALPMLMESARETGGVFAVILDGGADFVNDVNDAEECNAFVAELHSLAILHNCPIILVVHENPGQDAGKMRGHFGSQLERKAESNLRLRKSEEITVLFSEKMRGAPILEKDGPRFRWDNGAGMHLTCATVGTTKAQKKREKLADMAEAVFAHLGKDGARFAELVKGIADMRGVGASAAEDRFADMKAAGVIFKDQFGFWHFNPVTP
jgi:hypothetical protein